MNEYEIKSKKGGRKVARTDNENRRAEKRASCALRRARKEKDVWRRSA